jgi:hypothetical protein
MISANCSSGDGSRLVRASASAGGSCDIWIVSEPSALNFNSLGVERDRADIGAAVRRFRQHEVIPIVHAQRLETAARAVDRRRRVLRERHRELRR